MEMYLNGHGELDMTDEAKIQIVDEFKTIHQQIAKLWQANATMQREVLERASKIEVELSKITVILEKDGHSHRAIADQVFKNRDVLEQRGIRLDRLEQLAEQNKWVIRSLVPVVLGIIGKFIFDWVVR
jgi:hypothetical protein